MMFILEVDECITAGMRTKTFVSEWADNPWTPYKILKINNYLTSLLQQSSYIVIVILLVSKLLYLCFFQSTVPLPTSL